MGANDRLTFVTSSMRLSGGALVLAQLARGLQKRGYMMSFVGSAGGADPEVEEILPSEVQVLSARLTLEQTVSLTGKARLAWEMARLVPKCDTIIATHSPAVVPALMARHLLRRSRQAVWFHQDFAEMFEGRPIELWLLRHAPRWFDRVITISQTSRQEIEETSGVKASIVAQGYSLSSTDELPEYVPRQTDVRRIMFVGDRRPRKGWGDFLVAASLVHAKHKDLELAIVTKEDGPVDTLIPCTVHVRPSWDEFVDLCQSCRVFVSASWYESFGRPPLEAMACGAAVVTTDSGGVREYARDGHNCLMTPIRDPQALARAIEQVLNDNGLARRLGEAGRQTAQEFTWERAVRTFIQALEAGA